ncbi:MAG: hypothetical protein K9H16_04690 [Bacteroidales bacterium]|nr:hypothetical protein [Bacteroidales bacterium]
MERYISQLIEDLDEVANNPPPKPYIEPPPHMYNDPVNAELALVPFKTIEEWTGIKQEVFPDITQLQGNQWGRLNDAIFRVYASLNLELIDAPPDIPPEALYEALTFCWDQPVQYLPSSGMDLELCTYDHETCPYGEYCDCQNDRQENEQDDQVLSQLRDIDELPF